MTHMVAIDIISKLIVILTSTEDTNHREEQDLDSYRDVQIYVDVIAMLLVANVKNIDQENCNGRDIDIVQLIANILPEFLKYFKVTFLQLILEIQNLLMYILISLTRILRSMNQLYFYSL